MLDALLTPAQVAERLQNSTKTLDKWRCYKRGPRYIKLGNGLVRYEASAIEEWLAEEKGRRYGTTDTQQYVALPIQREPKDIRGHHAFRGHRTKSAGGASSDGVEKAGSHSVRQTRAAADPVH